MLQDLPQGADLQKLHQKEYHATLGLSRPHQVHQGQREHPLADPRLKLQFAIHLIAEHFHDHLGVAASTPFIETDDLMLPLL